MVRNTALTLDGEAGSLPSHLAQSASSKIAGMRSEIDAISLLAGTVAMTHASIGAGSSAISKRRQMKANPRGIRAGAEVLWREMGDVIPFGSSIALELASRVFQAMLLAAPRPD